MPLSPAQRYGIPSLVERQARLRRWDAAHYWPALDAECGLRFKNSSRYPDYPVRQLVKFAAGELPVEDCAIWVRNPTRGRCRWYTGTAWFFERYCVCRVASPQHFPMPTRRPYRRHCPVYQLLDWREAILAVAAHELWHLRQDRDNPRSSRYCARRHEELAAEEYLVSRLQAYRKLTELLCQPTNWANTAS